MAPKVTSQHFQHMEARLKLLRAKFLAREVSKQQKFPPDPADLDRIAAFRLLAHAEIEDYLELKAKAYVNAALADLKAKQSILRQFDLYALAQHFEKPLPVSCTFLASM
ncbi:hypothetical protein [Pandoraea norimbergensis]|uniref:Uncharacterized protein n=1 Tax=Pandoraea norimbergensis TaxID=93219 RepID=A0ABN4JEL8_9BURK|nr:hypothetical protein [Pandoraea norimbergensis]ALS59371.1 hypothetical protein AT302_05980 [Pandoraea norimbergensis]